MSDTLLHPVISPKIKNPTPGARQGQNSPAGSRYAGSEASYAEDAAAAASDAEPYAEAHSSRAASHSQVGTTGIAHSVMACFGMLGFQLHAGLMMHDHTT